VLAGPTAGGKSALAVDLALAVNAGALRDLNISSAEILTADAFQIYRGMDIGTAKPTPDERRGIPHHLLDLRDPSSPDKFTVSHWLALAREHIDRLRAHNTLPIVVGGTHLYVKVLLEGMFEGPGEDAALRAELHALPPEALRAELERVDPASAARLHANDLRRTIRAIEVFRLTGSPISAHQRQWDQPQAYVEVPEAQGPGSAPPPLRHSATSALGHSATPPLPFLLVGLDWPTDAINARINARVRDMMSRGLLDETRALLRPGLGPQASEALGYKQLLAHIRDHSPLEEAVERIKIETRRFAKNQRTWLKRLRRTPGSLWIDAAGTPPEDRVRLVLAALRAGRP
jgi:tRNA dimethylallyltransferase